jgi:glutamate--cysteine ligase
MKGNRVPEFITQILQQFSSDDIAALSKLKRGIEKEGLRCDTQGNIAQTDHPAPLGSALTHPYITTDYSESLLEFITPVFEQPEDMLNFLRKQQTFTQQNLTQEYVWPSSMPCHLDGDLSVPIAKYGSSNLGQLKHVYRHGLWHRYGRIMQAIAGIHFNFSMDNEFWPVWQKIKKNTDTAQEFKSKSYLGLIRNFRRQSWLLLYLFGASPALSRSFIDESTEHNLEVIGDDTLHLPYATSLRMSDLGYQNSAQSSLTVCYNDLSSYVTTLNSAVTQSVDGYEKIGLKENGQYKQLNTNLLQIENEYYSDVRPKRVAKGNEKPLQALEKKGIEYVEIRCLDINPYMAEGLDTQQVRFIDLFLIHCLLTDSPRMDDTDRERIDDNQKATVLNGRKPGLMLNKNGIEITLTDWAAQVTNELEPLAEALDQHHGNALYSEALTAQKSKIADPSLTPSAQIVAQMHAKQCSHTELMLSLAKQHTQSMAPLTAKELSSMNNVAEESSKRQAHLEAADDQSFDTFLANFLQREG